MVENYVEGLMAALEEFKELPESPKKEKLAKGICSSLRMLGALVRGDVQMIKNESSDENKSANG